MTNTLETIASTLAINTSDSPVTIGTKCYGGIHIHRGVKDNGTLERSGWTLSHSCGLGITYGIRFANLTDAKRAARLHLAIADGVLGRDKQSFDDCPDVDKKAMAELNGYFRAYDGIDWSGAEKHVVEHELAQGRAEPALYAEAPKPKKARTGNVTVRISTVNGPQSIPGYVIQGWQVHRPYSGEPGKTLSSGWDITHAPSGLSLVRLGSLPKAKRAVAILATLADNKLATMSKDDIFKARELTRALFQTRQYLNAEQWGQAAECARDATETMRETLLKYPTMAKRDYGKLAA